MEDNMTGIVESIKSVAENTKVNFDFSGWPGTATAMTAILATAATICFCTYTYINRN